MENEKSGGGELEALAAQAEGLEADRAQDAAGQDAGPGAAQGVPLQTNADLLAGTFQLARDVFCIIGEVQAPRMVLDDATVVQLGQAWGAVADKRGWDLSKLLGDYAAEVAAVMMTLTVGGKLVKAVRAEMDAKAPREAEPVGEVVADAG